MRTTQAFLRALVVEARRAYAEFAPTVLADLRAVTAHEVLRQVTVVLGVAVLEVLISVVGVTGPHDGVPRTGGEMVISVAVLLAVLGLRPWLSAPALPLAAGVVLQPPHLGGVVTVVLAYSAGYRIARPAWAGCVLVITALVWAMRLPTEVSSIAVAALAVAVFASTVLLPFLAGRHVAQRHLLASAHTRYERQSSRERSLLAAQARLRERNRIAQDMHDGLGHRLSLISVLTGALEVQLAAPDMARQTVRTLHGAAIGAMEDLATMVGALAFDGAGSAGQHAHTAQEVDRLVEGSRASGVWVDFQQRGPSRKLPAAVSHAVYRVVQEGLTNAHKHARGAPITVSVHYEPDALLVEVRNDTATPLAAPASPGTRLGLVGLNERVRLAGGVLHAGSTPEGGFRVAAILPYDTVAIVDREPDQ
ncbi:hypothetical protein GCM10010174_78940 [Kutzneria viridogrisea]|uniref:histidine kinase n=2 Tax=Kutzneria TaxID=43356 RepID=W5WD90_9PSEU|nr:histidine kinase [Kutzneria albida]AHH98715.1 hypothetical protein KALB_5353 [Kutzneria albida DSM 43870]MBA8923772.1 signal transduction histidine kinase [Kutzneria viridogrisea]